MRLVFAGLFVSTLVFAATPDGQAIYTARCAKCHDTPAERVPSRESLAKRAPQDVVTALTSGPMKPFAAGLSQEEIGAVATMLTGKAIGTTAQPFDTNACQGAAPKFTLDGPQWMGWGRDLDNSRYQPEPGIKPRYILVP